MSEEAQRLAKRIEEANQQLMAMVKRCSSDEWRRPLKDEVRSVDVVAHHVASAYLVETDLVETMAAGKHVSLTGPMIDEINANHAEEHAQPTQEETLELLQRNSQVVIDCVSKLTNAQLQRSSKLPFMGDRLVSTRQLIEEAIIDHINGHRRSMEAAIDKRHNAHAVEPSTTGH